MWLVHRDHVLIAIEADNSKGGIASKAQKTTYSNGHLFQRWGGKKTSLRNQCFFFLRDLVDALLLAEYG